MGCVPPFTDSMPDQALCRLVGRWGVGVAGWNTCAAWFEHVPVFVAGGLAHCWVLRRHLLCCGCAFLVRLLAGFPNARVVVRVVVLVVGGVVVC